MGLSPPSRPRKAAWDKGLGSLSEKNESVAPGRTWPGVGQIQQKAPIPAEPRGAAQETVNSECSGPQVARGEECMVPA